VAVEREMQVLPVGKAELRRSGKRVAILALGSMLTPALAAAEQLDATVANMRFVKPLDAELVRQLAREHELLVTVEENVVQGGAGSAVAECLQRHGVAVPLLQLGLPDRFIEQGEHAQMLADCGLDAAGIASAIRSRLAE
jgi:1-deoxy-D-xylulose-5-phosphate synthase